MRIINDKYVFVDDGYLEDPKRTYIFRLIKNHLVDNLFSRHKDIVNEFDSIQIVHRVVGGDTVEPLHKLPFGELPFFTSVAREAV